MFNELLRYRELAESESKTDVNIIAIEGPVCAGKSTLLHTLGTEEVSSTVIPEYMDYKHSIRRPNTHFPSLNKIEAKQSLAYFLQIEHLRYLDHMSAVEDITYLDRSIYTLLSFEIGVYYSSGVDVFTWALEEVADNKNIIVPDKVVYLDISNEESYKRAQAAGMNIPNFMFSESFNSGIKSFFTALNSVVPNYVTFINADQDPEAVVRDFKVVSNTW